MRFGAAGGAEVVAGPGVTCCVALTGFVLPSRLTSGDICATEDGGCEVGDGLQCGSCDMTKLPQRRRAPCAPYTGSIVRVCAHDRARPTAKSAKKPEKCAEKSAKWRFCCK